MRHDRRGSQRPAASDGVRLPQVQLVNEAWVPFAILFLLEDPALVVDRSTLP